MIVLDALTEYLAIPPHDLDRRNTGGVVAGCSRLPVSGTMSARQEGSEIQRMAISRFKRNWWISAGSFCATALLHLLLGVPLFLGTAARRPHFLPDSFGAGSSAIVSSAQFPPSMTLIELTPESLNDDYVLENLASRGVELPQAVLILSEDARPAPIEFDEDAIEDSEVTQAAGDTQGRAALFGRYMGQVTARIERAWRRPRSPIGADRFECETKIEQDRRGYVVSVELRRCNGNGTWQTALVAAIESASPLPAPPEPSLFTGTIVLSFDAIEYQPGISIEGEYEPPVRFLAGNATPTQTIVNPGKTIADVVSHEGNIQLTIEGQNTTWKLDEQDDNGQ